ERDVRSELAGFRFDVVTKQECFSGAVQAAEFSELTGQTGPDTLRFVERGKCSGPIAPQRKWSNARRRLCKGEAKQFGRFNRHLPDEMERQARSVGRDPSYCKGSE